MNGHGPGVPDLAGAGRVSVRAWTLAPTNALDILPGAVANDKAIAHARLIDLGQGVAIVAPLERRQLEGLADQIAAILAGE